MDKDIARILRKMKALETFIQSRRFQYAKSQSVRERLDREATKRHADIKDDIRRSIYGKQLKLNKVNVEFQKLKNFDYIARNRPSDMLYYYAAEERKMM